jgi:nitroreductase
MDVFEAIKGRRSCREFLPAAVSDDDIEKILEAASWAPSPANNQP